MYVGKCINQKIKLNSIHNKYLEEYMYASTCSRAKADNTITQDVTFRSDIQRPQEKELVA
jgi:hypothetical protein